MPTNRTPRVQKHRTPAVSEAAIALYIRGKTLMRRRMSEEAEREVHKIRIDLHLALQLKPWDDNPIDDEPAPHGDSELQQQGYERSLRAYEALETAWREHKRREREARRGAKAAAEPEREPEPVPAV